MQFYTKLCKTFVFEKKLVESIECEVETVNILINNYLIF